MDVASLIVESYKKFGFIAADTIDSMRNAQRLKVVQVSKFLPPTRTFLGLRHAFLPHERALQGAKVSKRKQQLAHVRYIKILTWLRGFLVFFLYLVWFSLCSSLLGIARQWSREKFAILSLKPRSHVRILMYWTWAIRMTQLEGNDLKWSCDDTAWHTW